ncbi:dTMP kinase [Parafrankia sp. EUN1f]|uniref:dTMP kinase n=1 Tax=Parafrankia sp. EUN1f TaxID=102897 RepID=UPI0001C45F1E|nr:dTMP kinase [Parafrankia sp. EUN1f]EFC81741.1 thymidylate kinase [Parafrankia sp. EUN1f]
MDLPLDESHGELGGTPVQAPGGEPAVRVSPLADATVPLPGFQSTPLDLPPSHGGTPPNENPRPEAPNAAGAPRPLDKTGQLDETGQRGEAAASGEPTAAAAPNALTSGPRDRRQPRMRVRRTLSRHPVTTVPSPPARSQSPDGSDGDLRAVLRIPEFRRMWIQLSLSSLGDWLGLLATTALITELASSFSGKAYAIGSLLIVRLLPALVLGPLAGAIADRLDRRMTMVVTDVMRFGLFVSIPIVHTLEWLLIASFLVECVSLVWAPAKEASIPRLVPRNRLAAANTLSLITTYGTAPLAAAIFTLLATVSRGLGPSIHYFEDRSLDLALYFNAATFLGSAIVIWGLRSIGKAERPEQGPEPGFFASITEGWKFVGQDRLVRGLVVGILGGFAGAGSVIALGKLYVEILGGGDSAYGVLFGAVFIGLAGGMAAGPRLLGDYSRTRLFGVCVTGAGITLVIVAIIPNLVIACILVVLVGAFAGVAWVTGYTLLQAEVADELRGRTFALVQSLVRVDLLLVLAAAPALVGLIGFHEVHLWGDINVRADGVTAVLLGGGLLAVAVGLFSYRQMDDHAGEAVLPELWNAVRGRRPGSRRRLRHAGLFITIEGDTAAGAEGQLDLLQEWLAASGREVVVVREKTGTPISASVRELLDAPSTRPHFRTVALLDAADRAEQVARIIEPALARGAIVLADRYAASSKAFQGADPRLDQDELAALAQWATHSLLPDVTVLLDLPTERKAPRPTTRPRRASRSDTTTAAADGTSDTTAPADSGTADATATADSGTATADSGTADATATADSGTAGDSAAYHQRVREQFRRIAAEDPARHVTVDATLPAPELHRQIRSVITERIRRTADAG